MGRHWDAASFRAVGRRKAFGGTPTGPGGAVATGGGGLPGLGG
ncbi:MAG: hypothetical protein QW101_08270 [Ignisphaera sp.]